MSLVATLVLPTGTSEFSGGSAKGSLGLNTGLALTDRLGLGSVIGASLAEGSGSDLDSELFASLSVVLSLSPATLFTEVFSVKANGVPASTGLNLGGAMAIGERGQIDGTFTLGLGSTGQDPGVNVGTSWLW